MSEAIYLASIGIFFGTILLIALIRSQTILRKARLEAQSGAPYRVIAERTLAAQEATAATLADLQVRLVAIEKVLKEVE